MSGNQVRVATQEVLQLLAKCSLFRAGYTEHPPVRHRRIVDELPRNPLITHVYVDEFRTFKCCARCRQDLKEVESNEAQ